jgi:hypothetical protein
VYLRFIAGLQLCRFKRGATRAFRPAAALHKWPKPQVSSKSVRSPHHADPKLDQEQPIQEEYTILDSQICYSNLVKKWSNEGVSADGDLVKTVQQLCEADQSGV